MNNTKNPNNTTKNPGSNYGRCGKSAPVQKSKNEGFGNGISGVKNKVVRVTKTTTSSGGNNAK